MCRLLVNSLRIQEDIKRNPEILDVPIHRPMFIVGLPRTVTTLLHNLLAQDPAVRVPLRWELLRPSPPPGIETRGTDPRIKYAQNEMRRLRIFAPQVFLIHPLNPTGPDKCIHLFKKGFASFSFSMLCNIPKYLDWLFQQDMIPTYSYYRNQLQLVQWRCPGKYWILKPPSHLFSFNALFAVFPDACVVQTHRDPLKAVASFFSMVPIIRKMYSDHEDLKQIGKSCLSLLSMAFDRAIKTREKAHTQQFCDVRYHELIDDPIGIVKDIYRYFGCDMDLRIETGMKCWLRDNSQHKSGVHRYSLDLFGMDPYRVKQCFAGYMERFKIRAE
ncbi:MAG: sulfotransferase [Thermodesulfobacteriota bacterium]|nr:sulfotransferase [Thermodesulfobacteriota bacterium]